MARDSLPNVKLRHLHFLLALAEQRHLGRAAEAMHMTQPAASRLLAELEQTFGRALFERGRHGLRALPEAAEVLRFARMVRAEERLVVQALQAGGGPGAVRIGTLPTLPAVVIEAVRACKRARSVGTVNLRQDTLDALLPPLLDGELDLVVGRFDPVLSTGALLYERLIEEGLSVVCSPRHPLAGRRQIPPEELVAWPWVVPQRGSSLYPHFAEIFAGLPLPADVIECASPLGVHAFVQDDATLGLLSASVSGRLSRQGIRVLPVRLRSSPGPLGIYRVRERPVPESPAAMAAALHEAARRLAGGAAD